ncbi:hypothetical protein F4780DRAFT_765660 [Xylariomycetidae sp. FL0641]|nr:hypothetical protein F4780DRAFT_765660 [Xylariomycetidae sp. FL0641]
MVFYGLLSLLFILVGKAPSIIHEYASIPDGLWPCRRLWHVGSFLRFAACSAVPCINRLVRVCWALALRGQVWLPICWQ